MVRVKGPQRPDDIVGHGAGEGAYVITIWAASQSAPKISSEHVAQGEPGRMVRRLDPVLDLKSKCLWERRWAKS